MTPEQVIRMLNLQPHPREGAFFLETYRSGEAVTADALPARYKGSRAMSTAIYYMVKDDSRCHIHRLKSDEVWHFYLGDPLELLLLDKGGSGRIVTLGVDLEAGIRPQLVVPAGTWQGARVQPGGKFSLVGTTVSPGFEYTDYEDGEQAKLVEGYPKFYDLILALTRPT